MLSNLSDFNPVENRVAPADLPELDRWALVKYEELKKKILNAYDKYEFHSIYHAVNYFCGMTMSAFYLDIIKDRLYTAGTDSLLRRAAQTVLYDILDGILRLISPILSFTASEAWESLHDHDDATPLTESIFFTEFPAVKDADIDGALETRWNHLIRIRSEITRALEIARRDKIIGHPLEAEVLLSVEGDLAEFVKQEWQTIKEICIVSELTELQPDTAGQLTVMEGEELPGLKVAVKAAPGEKCERCWIRSTTVGENSVHPQICDRCAAVVANIDLPVEE
jgi:isoleucyl-tRNA synthetase